MGMWRAPFPQPEHPDTINAMHNAAIALAAEGHTAEAQRRLSEILELGSRVLGREQVTHLLVEGSGEVHASFLAHDLAHRVAFFYAPKILGGTQSLPVAGGIGIGLGGAGAQHRAVSRPS